ncbi:hypothetical protein BDA96_02G107000 [Sorghum bicolor]|nr:hypothetical protein BDA96_02G107000 [Sorghum bicolor]KAG0542471.1 hypothetical protein BDA96_02G107000 [Sorghum bicolor]KAG0542472.1 hypothetical protein BDA96_02G107000 [Sorghum bicolor]KAG0542473.1 hypothetical protein BDA96_02G107000 [Sorghum bicolor]
MISPGPAARARDPVLELRRTHRLGATTSIPVTVNRMSEIRTDCHEDAGELCPSHRECLIVENPVSRCPPSAVPCKNGQAGPGSSSSPSWLLADL